MQGGEAPTIIIILHQSHKRMLFREWLYTAITRASQRCIVLYTNQALMCALNKQNIKGSTLEQKVQAFVKLQEKGIAGASVTVNIPEPESLSKELVAAGGQSIAERGAERTKKELTALSQVDDTRCLTCGSQGFAMSSEEGMCEFCDGTFSGNPPPPPPPPPPSPEIRTIIIERVIRETVERDPARPLDSGELQPAYDMNAALRKMNERMNRIREEQGALRAPAIGLLLTHIPQKLTPQIGAVLMQQRLEDENRLLRLTHMPAPKPVISFAGLRLMGSK